MLWTAGTVAGLLVLGRLIGLPGRWFIQWRQTLDLTTRFDPNYNKFGEINKLIFYESTWYAIQSTLYIYIYIINSVTFSIHVSDTKYDVCQSSVLPRLVVYLCLLFYLLFEIFMLPIVLLNIFDFIIILNNAVRNIRWKEKNK